MKLKKYETVNIVPLKPFTFDPTFHKPDHFTSADNDWQPGIRWQTFFWQNMRVGVKFVNKGTLNNPKIAVKIFSKNALNKQFVSSLIDEIKYRYNLELDLSDFYKKFRNERLLSPIIKKFRGMRPGHPSSLYEYLIIGVVLQNATVKRSVNMLKVLLEKYGTLLEFDGKKLWCFWKPGKLQKVSEKELRTLKVGYRAKSIKKIDNQFARGLIDEQELRKLDRKTQMEELLKLYGVGPATVWYLLFDVFHHLDFFNHISPWEQKIYSKLFYNRSPSNPVSVKKLLKYLNKYDKYKHLAVHYIWEDIFWKRKNEHIPWLEKEIRL